MPADPRRADAQDLGGIMADRTAANQADSVAADTAAMVVDFNLLLDKLKAAGLMVADA